MCLIDSSVEFTAHIFFFYSPTMHLIHKRTCSAFFLNHIYTDIPLIHETLKHFCILYNLKRCRHTFTNLSFSKTIYSTGTRFFRYPNTQVFPAHAVHFWAGIGFHTINRSKLGRLVDAFFYLFIIIKLHLHHIYPPEVWNNVDWCHTYQRFYFIFAGFYTWCYSTSPFLYGPIESVTSSCSKCFILQLRQPFQFGICLNRQVLDKLQCNTIYVPIIPNFMMVFFSANDL